MTPLGDILCRRIGANGPITLADFMAECLLHPQHGYYATRDPLGAAGDFTTAPEISQMFGELIGLAIAQAWLDQGAPDPFALVEFGPGRGTLMADMLRATRGVPGLHAAVQVHMVEASPVLRRAQAAALPGITPTWHDGVDSLPEMPVFMVANEFFDALPIRQFRRATAGWSERHVTCGGETLGFGWSQPAPLAALDHRLNDTHDTDIIEICPAASPIILALVSRIKTHGGCALCIDYGGWRSRGDTFQALCQHAMVDPLEAPGLADLTAHVDFEALARAANQIPGIRTSPMVPQGVFLERLGITPRARTLANRLTGAAQRSHIAAHRRLTHPDEMGSLFKCLAFTPLAAPPFPGLSE